MNGAETRLDLMNEHSWKDEEGGCLMSALTATGVLAGLIVTVAVTAKWIVPAILEMGIR